MLTDLELTLLCLVSEAPRHGSQLESILESRGVRDWLTVGSASLYYVLDKLQKQTLITRVTSTNSGNTALDDPIYTITEGGRGVLQTAIAERLGSPHALGSGFELGLANLGVLRPIQVYAALRQHRARLAHQREGTEETWRRMSGSTVAPTDAQRALYSHGLALMQAELDWIDQFLHDWRTRYPAVDGQVGVRDTNDELAAITVIHRKTGPLGARERAKHAGRFTRPDEGNG